MMPSIIATTVAVVPQVSFARAEVVDIWRSARDLEVCKMAMERLGQVGWSVDLLADGVREKRAEGILGSELCKVILAKEVP